MGSDLQTGEGGRRNKERGTENGGQKRKKKKLTDLCTVGSSGCLKLITEERRTACSVLLADLGLGLSRLYDGGRLAKPKCAGDCVWGGCFSLGVRQRGISGDRLRSTPTRFQNPTTTKSSPQANRQEVSRESKHSRWICPPSPAGRPPCVFTFFFLFLPHCKQAESWSPAEH